MDDQPRRIGIFGGTFNPVHNGHVSIANDFLESGSINALWIFLNPSPPHKENEPFAPYRLRLKMLQKAFESFDNAFVSDLETDLPTPSYTIQTLSYLTDTYPHYSFFLCIGRDSYLSFKSWHRWQDILERCRLLVADRPIENEKDKQIDLELSAYTNFIEHQPVDISSTQVRNRAGQGKSISDLVPPAVAEIINEEQLYTG